MSPNKIIDAGSKTINKTEVDLFSVLPTEISVESSLYQEILPTSSVENKPFHFEFNSGSTYYDLASTLLSCRVKIVKVVAGVESNLADIDNVALVNGFGSVFVKDLRMSIGTTTITNQTLYSYIAYMWLKMSTSDEAKRSLLEACGYYSDDDCSTTCDSYNKRKALAALSKEMEYVTTLRTEMTTSNRYLLPQTDIVFEMSPWSDNHLIHAGDDTIYKLKFTKVSLFVKMVILNSGINLDIHRILQTKPANYPCRRLELKTYHVPENLYQINYTMTNNVLPRRVFVGFVDTAKFVGSLRSTPFQFTNASVKEINLTYNGVTNPNVPYDLDFTRACCTKPFYDLLTTLGYHENSPSNCGLSLKEFVKTFTIFAFSTTPSLEDAGQDVFEIIRSGTIILNCKFSNPVPVGGLLMLILTETDGNFTIDALRTVSSDVNP